jgi:hypothetical protein
MSQFDSFLPARWLDDEGVTMVASFEARPAHFVSEKRRGMSWLKAGAVSVCVSVASVAVSSHAAVANSPIVRAAQPIVRSSDSAAAPSGYWQRLRDAVRKTKPLPDQDLHNDPPFPI